MIISAAERQPPWAIPPTVQPQEDSTFRPLSNSGSIRAGLAAEGGVRVRLAELYCQCCRRFRAEDVYGSTGDWDFGPLLRRAPGTAATIRFCCERCERTGGHEHSAACEVLQWRMAEAGRDERLREIKRMLRIGLRDPRCTYYGINVSWYSTPSYATTAEPEGSPAYARAMEANATADWLAVPAGATDPPVGTPQFLFASEAEFALQHGTVAGGGWLQPAHLIPDAMLDYWWTAAGPDGPGAAGEPDDGADDDGAVADGGGMGSGGP